MTDYTFSHNELSKLMCDFADMVVKKNLEELGLLKKIYTRAEVEKIYGRAMFEKSKMYVKWQKKGGGKTSPVICQRTDFEEFLRKFNAELKPMQSKGII